MEQERQRNLLGAEAGATVPRAAEEDLNRRLGEAIARSRDHLLSLQAEDGHWCGELEGDSILESEFILAMHFLGRIDEPVVRKAGNRLRRLELPEGGWPVYPGGPPEVSASVKAYFVLKLLGDDPAAAHMARAREAIRHLGGLEACNSFTKIYLAIFGQYDWHSCPAVPPEMILLPRWSPFNIWEMSAWSRTIFVPLSIVWAHKPSCPVPEGAGLSELRGEPRRRPRRPPALSWASWFALLDTLWKRYEPLHPRPLRRRALRRAERWVLTRLEGSDGLGAIFPPIVYTVLSLRCLGYSLDHPTVSGQIRQLEKLLIEEGETVRVQPCFSPVWDTAQALKALLESGLAPDHPAVLRGARWLLERQVRTAGDWVVHNPHREAGGWYFEYANEFYPDCDDTAEVLTVLSKVRFPLPEEDAARRDSIQRGSRWLLSMQNRDGGWASFDRGCDKRFLTQIPFADHNAMIDPSTSDITGRALETLACLDFERSAPTVRAAEGFLRRQQEADGAWYGRWGCNYIYGTWLALWGLGAIGAASHGGAQRRAAAWLRSCQNLDGGWGELPLSYDDPGEKGRGPSTAAQTAWALLALLAAGDGGGGSLRRGIEYLLRHQEEDGSWTDEHWTGTGFPKVFYLRYHLYPVYFPLLALAAAGRRLGGGRRPEKPAA